uniref:Flap endonuclease GEN-like 2 n=1 Tax=Ananas comosus var. bracteatus TaxID=296719 RepID=A0A6V7NRA6_ANACO|nr:unnamed protein product [Ananas comosus var. bracteatus]
MGVKNLWDILESCKKTLPLHHLQNKRLCVDLSCWLIQLRNANRSPACVVKKLYLRGLFHRLRALIALNCSLVLVTDGSIPSIKLSTYRRRLGSGSELNPEEANSQTMTQAVPSLRRNMGSEFSCMIKEAKVLGKALGIPCLDGIEEAEAQCALLNSASLCDGCFTSDSDIFLFGARTVYRDIILEGGYVICYEMVDVEHKLGFGRNSLISLALLLGGDYSNRVYGFGPKEQWEKKPGKLANTDVNKENEICLKQNFCETGNKPVSDGQFLEVINAYLKPKCHSPDSEAVQRVYTEHPFLRLELQRICEQFFGWSPEKTDQYILPKIAERDLRRFANLRSRSSVLGVRIPFSEIPVPCPVSAIVKQRKVQGRECYEVSWQHVDGLDISTIPADLIESACPEKITEFTEKKDEAKKQTRKPRTRKPNKNAVAEVDLQLKGLLLSIESQSNALTDITNRSKPTNVDTVKPIVIDLSSPSPPLHACKVAKCQKTTGQNVVIEVYESESESEVSSEHARKARELRLFIDSIRHDLR